MSGIKVLYIASKEKLTSNMYSCCIETTEGPKVRVYSESELNSLPTAQEYYEKTACMADLKSKIHAAHLSYKGLSRCKLNWDEIESLGWEKTDPGIFKMIFNFLTPCELQVFLDGTNKHGNLLLRKNRAVVFFGYINTIYELKNLMKRHGLFEIL